MRSSSHKSFATIATIAILAAASLSGCGKNPDQAGWWQGEQERIELHDQLELKQFRFEQAYSRDFEQLESLRRAAKESTWLLKTLREQRLTLGSQIESMQQQWAGFRESTLRTQRQRALGRTFEELGLISGRKFKAVTVAAIDDAGVTIRHADGSARLRFADLDSSQRRFFGLEADLASAAGEKETQDAAAYERWVATRMVAIEEKKLKESEIAGREALASRQTQAALTAQVIAASNARPLGQPATSVGNRSWTYSGYYSNYRTYRPTYRYVYDDYSPEYSCQPSPNIYAGKVIAPDYYGPTIVPKRNFLDDTTLPSIP